MDIGKKIYTFRKAKKISNYQLSDMTGISAKQLFKFAHHHHHIVLLPYSPPIVCTTIPTWDKSS